MLLVRKVRPAAVGRIPVADPNRCIAGSVKQPAMLNQTSFETAHFETPYPSILRRAVQCGVSVLCSSGSSRVASLRVGGHRATASIPDGLCRKASFLTEEPVVRTFAADGFEAPKIVFHQSHSFFGPLEEIALSSLGAWT